LTALQPAVVIQLEMVVCVDQPGQHDGTGAVDDRVAGARRVAQAENARGEAHRLGDAAVRDGVDVHEAHGMREHHAPFTAWNTPTTCGLPHRRRNAFTPGSPASLKRGSRIVRTCRPACSRAARWSSIECAWKATSWMAPAAVRNVRLQPC